MNDAIDQDREARAREAQRELATAAAMLQALNNGQRVRIKGPDGWRVTTEYQVVINAIYSLRRPVEIYREPRCYFVCPQCLQAFVSAAHDLARLATVHCSDKDLIAMFEKPAD